MRVGAGYVAFDLPWSRGRDLRNLHPSYSQAEGRRGLFDRGAGRGEAVLNRLLGSALSLLVGFVVI